MKNSEHGLAVVLLLVLLPSFLINSRTPGRRVTCINNQYQLAKAMLNYESYKKFPGYVNRIGTDSSGNDIVAGWVVPLFPHLGRNDLAKRWRGGTASNDLDGDGRPDAHVYMRLLVCSSDPPKLQTPGSTPLSYVVNCGLPGASDTLADGVFFNHDLDSEPLAISLDYLIMHDGAQHTLLLSENIQAGRWTNTTEANLGMVWRKSPGPCSGVNQCVDAGDRPQNLKYARPSSHHPSGVIATFCDGHGIFVNDDVDYRVYQHLMTPDSATAGVLGEFAEDDLE